MLIAILVIFPAAYASCSVQNRTQSESNKMPKAGREKRAARSRIRLITYALRWPSFRHVLDWYLRHRRFRDIRSPFGAELAQMRGM